MFLSSLAQRVLALAIAVYRWGDSLADLDHSRRAKVARYAELIAATLARAGEALARLEERPGDKASIRHALSELGRIGGYVETIVDVLRHHLDGRKLAGVKRRLAQLAVEGRPHELATLELGPLISRLAAAEGYFRALADALRA